MSAKRALIISSLLHLMLLITLSFGNIWWSSAPKRPPLALEANLLYRESVSKKDLLPKKNPKKVVEKAEKVVEKKPDQPPKAKEDALVKEKVAVKEAKASPKTKPVKEVGSVAVAKSKDFSKTLAELSKNFATELSSHKEEEKTDSIEELAADDNYFQHVYSLIKESFVVPPHINGPQGKNLSAVLRIFLARDGTLNKLDLEKPSGDIHFDKAVQEGTLRVHNFGRVPILLQDTLSKVGIVVELCPFKCVDKS